MKSKNILLLIVLAAMFLISCADDGSQQEQHAFILFGQSNMVHLDPNESFIPIVQTEFGKNSVIVVKDAMGGQPIRRWYKGWESWKGDELEATGDLYDRLMIKVNVAIKGKWIRTFTLIWMQGERDAQEEHGDVYGVSLEGLFDQFKEDLRREDINFVIGRLSDWGLDLEHWVMVCQAQVEVAETYPNCAWVDTDDLNDGVNKEGEEIEDDLHYSVEGYKILGQRFAEEAIQLIKE